MSGPATGLTMLGDRASADHGSSLRCTRLYACRSRTDGQKAITRISPLAFGRARTAPRSGADPLLWRLLGAAHGQRLGLRAFLGRSAPASSCGRCRQFPGPQSQRPIDIICGAAIVVARYGSVVQKPTLERFGTDPVNGTRGGERKLEPDSAFAPRSAQVLLIAGKDPRQWRGRASAIPSRP